MAHNRESWLQAAAEEFRPLFERSGHSLPERVKVSVGWPSQKALSSRNRRIGECWDATSSADGVAQIFISPVLAEPIKALGVLVHELVHAAVGCECGHKGAFITCAKQVGLTPKWTATGESVELVAEITRVIEVIGPFPHAELRAMGKIKKQSTRLLKVHCPTDEYIVRVTRTTIDDHGCPICPVCQAPMQEASK